MHALGVQRIGGLQGADAAVDDLQAAAEVQPLDWGHGHREHHVQLDDGRGHARVALVADVGQLGVGLCGGVVAAPHEGVGHREAGSDVVVDLPAGADEGHGHLHAGLGGQVGVAGVGVDAAVARRGGVDADEGHLGVGEDADALGAAEGRRVVVRRGGVRRAAVGPARSPGPRWSQPVLQRRPSSRG